MSSKWVEIRDSVEDALQIEEVKATLKGRFIDWLGDEGIDFVQSLADAVISECKRDAPSESGWSKIRDAFVVPAAVNIGMVLLKLVIEKAAAENK
jgi:hypothetical protein